MPWTPVQKLDDAVWHLSRILVSVLDAALKNSVTPAEAGVHELRAASRYAWMPAFAGMTDYFDGNCTLKTDSCLF
jgi:hypothetical protein